MLCSHYNVPACLMMGKHDMPKKGRTCNRLQFPRLDSPCLLMIPSKIGKSAAWHESEIQTVSDVVKSRQQEKLTAY